MCCWREGPPYALCHAQGPLEELPDAVEGEPVTGRRRGALRSCLETVRWPLARGLNMSARNVFIAGAELGGWAFTANAIMVSCVDSTLLKHAHASIACAVPSCVDAAVEQVQ